MDAVPPTRILCAIFLGIALFLAGFGVFILIFSHGIFEVPRGVPDTTTSDSPPVVVSRTFPFQNGSATVTIFVNASLYAASKKTFRSTFLLGDPNDLGTRYYQAMINDPTQEPVYQDLLSRFRTIRDERNLSDDEYLELMTAYVQTIAYKNGGNAPPKYPAELLVENMGDCDDKAILLSGLLAREGYPVVLFKFGPESHMAMGIGSDSFPYKSTGYTYLEAMTPSYVGIPSFYVIEHRMLHSDPLVLPVSNGTRMYTSGAMTSHLYNTSILADQRAAEITLRLDQIPEAERTGSEYTSLASERDRYRAIRQYIVNHPNDRRGVNEYLKENPVAPDATG